LTDYDKWSDTVTLKVGVAAGSQNNLLVLSSGVNAHWETMTKTDETIHSIGLAYSNKGSSDLLTIQKPFTDRSIPVFKDGYPQILNSNLTSTTATIDVLLDRAGTVYYVVAPQRIISATPKKESGSTSGGTSDSSGSSDSSGGTSGSSGSSDPTASGSGSGGDATTTTQTEGDKLGVTDIVVTERGKDPDLTDSNRFYVSSPDLQHILNPSYYYPRRTDIKSGSLSYSAAVTSLPKLEGLEPDTPYYAYFVLQGNGEVYSDVMVYQFTTPKMETPTIDLNALSNVGKIMVEKADSNVYYALVEANNMPAELFEDITISDTSTNPATPIQSLVDPNTPMTVREALQTNISGSMQSYFDVYADKDLKQKVQEYIRGVSSGTSYVDKQPLYRSSIKKLSVNTIQNIDFSQVDGIKSGPEYYLLAVAQHVSDTDYTVCGYKAVKPIYIPDTVPPSYIGPAAVTDAIHENADGTYSGTFTLRFDKEIYHVYDDNGSRIRRVVCPVSTDDADESKLAEIDGESIFKWAGGTMVAEGKIKVVSTNPYEGSNIFAFKVDKVEIGDTFTLFSKGWFANYSSATTTSKLVVTFEKNVPATDFQDGILKDLYMPGFTVTWQ
jgi:hypothetical protein